VGIDSNSSIPVQSVESPGQWSRDSWDMDQSWVGCMSKVQRREVEEVDNQDQLCDHEMAADEQHDECELKEVVEDKVTSNSSGSLNLCGGLGEEVPHVYNLEEEESKPIQRGNQGIEREWSLVVLVLSPNGVVVCMVSIMRLAICIVNADNDIQQPSQNRKDLVGPDSLSIVALALREGVGIRESHCELLHDVAADFSYEAVF